MKRLLPFLLCLMFALPARAEEDALQSVTVLVDNALSEAMVVLAREYSRDSGVTVNAVFGETPELRRAVEDGEAGDAFLAASHTAIDRLEQQGLVDVYNRMPFARTGLTLIANPAYAGALTPRAGIQAPELGAQLAGAPVFLMANPDQTIEGATVRHALEALGWWAQVSPIVAFVDGRQIAREAGKRHGALAVTVSVSAKGLGIRSLGELPDGIGARITYHAAVVAGEHMPQARAFVRWLLTPKAQQILRVYGFGAVP